MDHVSPRCTDSGDAPLLSNGGMLLFRIGLLVRQSRFAFSGAFGVDNLGSPADRFGSRRFRSLVGIDSRYASTVVTFA